MGCYEGRATLRANLCREWNMHWAGRAVGEVGSGVVNLADEYLADIDGCFVIQTEVRVRLHDVEREAKISQMSGSQFVQHDIILLSAPWGDKPAYYYSFDVSLGICFRLDTPAGTQWLANSSLFFHIPSLADFKSFLEHFSCGWLETS